MVRLWDHADHMTGCSCRIVCGCVCQRDSVDAIALVRIL